MKRYLLISTITALGALLAGLILWGVSSGATRTLAATPATALPVFWQEYFSGTLPTDKYYITNTINSGVVADGYFRLTRNAQSQRGRIFYMTPTLMTEFSASFSLFFGVNTTEGADGAAFIFCPKYNYTPNNGSTLDAGCPEGYIVAFDTWGDATEATIYLSYGNTNMENRLDSKAMGNLEDGKLHGAKVIFNQGAITVTLDTVDIITHTISGYEPFYGYFGFSAATGYYYNEQRLDNIEVKAETVPYGYLDGHVYDAATMDPIKGVTVTSALEGGKTWSEVTDLTGYYNMIVGPDTYTVTTEREFYDTGTAIGVNVLSYAVTTVDFPLTAKVTFDPSPVHVTLGWQQTFEMTATLLNRETEAYNFEFIELVPTFIPTGLAQAITAGNGVSSDRQQAYSTIASTPSSTPGADVLLIQDSNAWGVAAMTTILESNSIAYDLINSSQIGSWNFSVYKMIIIPSVQGSTYYTQFNNNLSKFEQFINHGGVMLMSFCTQGEIVKIPFGGTNFYYSQAWNYINVPDNLIFAGVDNPYYGTSASCSIISGLLGDDLILVTTGNAPGGEPVMIERHSGKGLLVAGGQMFEWGWKNSQGAGTILKNMIHYHYYRVDWLGEEPISGTVPASTNGPGVLSANLTFTATLDAGIDQPGDYYATLLVAGDPLMRVPITMTVVLPASFGKLEGTVMDLGYCDENPAPLTWVEVLIEGADGYTETLVTDGTGRYQWWLDQAHNPLTVSVSAPEYTHGEAMGVTIVSGQTTTQDFALRWLEPCGSTVPSFFNMKVGLGYTETARLQIANEGAASSDFWLMELFNALPTPRTGPAWVGIPQAMIENELKESPNEGEGVGLEASGGPDSFGYTFEDSKEPDGPAFGWIEIAPPAGGSGTEIAFLGDFDENYFYPVPISFPFNFYGTEYTQLAVGTNGTLDFVDDYIGYENSSIPGTNASGVNTFIAPLWDDLMVTPGAVYYLDLGDKIIIEYYQVSAYLLSPGNATWEVILFANGNILFQYKDVTFNSSQDLGAEATIGIQGDTTTGLQYSYDSPSLSDNLAICFTYPGNEAGCKLTNVPWLSEEPISGTLGADSVIDIEVTFDSITHTLGTYTASLALLYNDPMMPLINIPVTMTVVVPIPPTAAFASNSPVLIGQEMEFTNTSTPGVPSMTTFEWDFGDETPIVAGTMAPISHLYKEVGSYLVTLEACSAFGCDDHSALVVVNLRRSFLPCVVSRR